ncbi:alpha/beta fold hydrolase [Phaeovulum sp. W22_SRMD_FR3]|uniref:alpha/beta fold hydrolase n=1 Tax=Phaeovulum sp. W22_SRMD_FR3 TaxID=3240274 RepID=UPI003F98D0A2
MFLLTQTATVHTEDGDIVYDREGRGAVVVTIPGGGGNGARFARLSAHLSDDYCVVRYDRRCNSRSSGDPTVAFSMAQQARDVVAILDAMGVEKAYLLGQGGGGGIALEVVTLFPDRVAGALVHEVPILQMLPDMAKWVAFTEDVGEVFRAEGAGAAMMRFNTGHQGYQLGENGVGDHGSAGNMEYFFASEMPVMSMWMPDLAALRRHLVPVMGLIGRESAEAYYSRATQALCSAIDCPMRVIAGRHVAFSQDPAALSADILACLGTLRESETGAPRAAPGIR